MKESRRQPVLRGGRPSLAVFLLGRALRAFQLPSAAPVNSCAASPRKDCQIHTFRGCGYAADNVSTRGGNAASRRRGRERLSWRSKNSLSTVADTSASDRSYYSETRAATLGGCWRWCFKDHSGNIVLAPDSFADVNSSEVVEAKFEPVWQLLGFESKLDANTRTGEIVNGAMVNGRVLNQDPRWAISLGAL